MSELSPRFVPGDGPIPCSIMIVGEAPGREEDEALKPFVGQAGRLLNDALVIAGLPRERVYVTNIVKQRPPENRKPTEEEILQHIPLVILELTKVRPTKILLLGNTALHSLTYIDGGIMRHRGKISSQKTLVPDFIDVYATVHPSAALRSKNNKVIFYADIAVFAQIAH